METKADEYDIGALACPVPLMDHKQILLAHGSGGRLTQQLIRNIVLPHFKNDLLESLHDGAMFSVDGVRVAFSTDSYVVHPIFFPGGDIGSLAVHGTVNDLAMCGARPLYLSVSFIIEEGLPISEFEQVVASMRKAADRAHVSLVTGDTKVVDRGKGDKLFITTSGVGVIEQGVDIRPTRAMAGDDIILSGPVGTHGIAIMSVREGLEFETPIESDTAPMNDLVQTMLNACKDVHVFRDPTRGGLATTLNELAEQARLGILVEEDKIPVTDAVQGACEILGLDPLYVANEGVLVAFIPPDATDSVLQVMRNHPLARNAVVIGKVVQDHPGTVALKTSIGSARILDLLSGEQLPRIC
jgi:hydrogenase expression/formation protein HypE